MSLTKLSLTGNNLIIPSHGEFGKWLLGWGWENRYPFFPVQGSTMVFRNMQGGQKFMML
jgi:hypothetical protein